MEESMPISEENGADGTSPQKSRFTKKQWVLLVLFAVMNLISTLAYSLQAPFYPQEAEKKGATATEYGFVFGIYEFTIFIGSPIFGKYMNKLGPKTVFNVCVSLASVAVICFGVLDKIIDRTLFISLSLLCRFVEGFGCGGFLPATFTIIACGFPDSVATIFAILESFAGFGLIVGPTVGEALFTMGGFSLPFYTIGSLLLFSGLVCCLAMPKIEKVKNEDGTEQIGYSIWTILRFPSVSLAFLSLASATISTGFINATLEPHIRQFGLSPMQTGLMFIIVGGTYSLTAPVWGYICDRIRKPIYVTLLGNMLTGVAFLFIGPASFMPFDTTLWLTIVGLVLEGLAMACCNVAGFSVGLKESLNNGLPDNISTNSAVSGLWQAMMSLGAWVGPIIAGVLYDNVGFRQGSWVVLAISFTMAALIVIEECYHLHKNKGNTPLLEVECQPLIKSENVAEKKGKREKRKGRGPRAPPLAHYGSTA